MNLSRLGSSRMQHLILMQILAVAELQCPSALPILNELMEKGMGVTSEADVVQLYEILERAGADREVLAAVGSWGDTLSGEDVLEILELCSLRT